MRETDYWRVWSKVSPSDDGCWTWTGTLAEGYGVIAVGKKGKRAHRLVYEMVRGDIPDGLVLDHLCRNPRCVNPAHLDPVTGGENVRRGNSFSSANRAKMHCAAGHPLSGTNLLSTPQGRRVCRECNRAHCRAWYDRNERKRVA